MGECPPPSEMWDFFHGVGFFPHKEKKPLFSLKNRKIMPLLLKFYQYYCQGRRNDLRAGGHSLPKGHLFWLRGIFFLLFSPILKCPWPSLAKGQGGTCPPGPPCSGALDYCNKMSPPFPLSSSKRKSHF